MDFITKLPRTAKRHDTVWVIVDRLTKSAHFLPIRETYTSERLYDLFVKEIVTRHGVPVSIVSDRDTRFTSRFWKQFHDAMGTRLNISTAYHPQTDGQSERTIQTLEDMLRACIIDFGGSWDDHLPLVEFSYNNSYHSSIGMPPYEALYGRRCRTPVCWGEVGQKEMGNKAAVIDMAEKLRVIKARMKAAQDRQKSYADKRRRPIKFDVGDRVLLKVSPWKGIIRFRKRGKLSPRYIGPFHIKARVGKVAYRLDLPEELNGIHPTFHVSHLRKCLADEQAYVPLDDIEVDDRLNYIEEPVAIVDTKEKQLRNKTFRQVRVQWKHRKGSDTTWETEDEMRRLRASVIRLPNGDSYGHPFDPTRVTQISWHPRAFLYRNFLTDAECDHLIQLAKDKLEKSMVADNESGKSIESEVRTSSGMFLNKAQDEVVAGVESRISAWTFLPVENGESMQILHYENGQKYEPHWDYFHDKANQALGGHRIATVLMYLSNVRKGGETVFPESEIKESQPKLMTIGLTVRKKAMLITQVMIARMKMKTAQHGLLSVNAKRTLFTWSGQLKVSGIVGKAATFVSRYRSKARSPSIKIQEAVDEPLI
ncbi:hypothetical protein E3N88_30258 [Mikania micrantha]|uniref:Integrase catalytic domain-containing protein n=1 Tax=Mikania micrantha TaxID=192012 RepID=A0A5N6ML39_9ASTR|nr:hypothetical protein E3N88_30258 [Mikania micrantha]